MSDPREDFLFVLPGLIADRIKTAMPGLQECKGIAGRFNLERLKSQSVRAPAVLVSMVGLRQQKGWAGPHHGFRLDMAAFIMTRDMLALDRDQAGANIAQVIAGMIPDQRWGQSQCGEADTVSADPLVTQGSLKLASSLWAVTWRQPCVLKSIPPSQVQPLSIYLGRDPDIGADNVDDYDLVAGQGDTP